MSQIAACGPSYDIPSAAQVSALRSHIEELVADQKYNCPLFVRLSWHDAGTFDKNAGNGGPRACMRKTGGEADHGANAGLQIAVELLNPVCEKFPQFSTADIWSLTACCAIKEMGGPEISWRPGRHDERGMDSAPEGRLPDATQGCPHLRDVFYKMGFSD